MTTVVERNIQIELYRILQNLIINEKFSFDDIQFTNVRFEPTINGRPDLVVEAIDKGKRIPILVIETKRKVPFIDRKFDPYSKDVIRQASTYAVELGAPYFATCNGEVLVVFDTFTAGVPLPQRRLKHYKVYFEQSFAKMILEEVCRFRRNIGKWLELDDVFLQRLRTYHTFITPYILKSLNQRLRDDLKFKEEYVRWLKSQLFAYSPKMNETIAEQLSYMLMNRLTFYKTLETQISTLPKLLKIDTADSKVFSGRLRQVFDKVCKDVDYEPIFEPHTILDQMSLSKELIYALNDFIEELGTYDLAKIQSDVVGRVYEELIPEDERHRLGQYYTPPPIIELITDMCIKSPNDRVLDPACGSGGFLVKAYHKLRDLKKKENPFAEDSKLHEEILNQLYGIDINPFPVQLTSINLAVRNLKVTSRNISLIVSDFFKVKPTTTILPREYDVVVTNPPYTRQEEMEYKDEIRDEALTYSDGSTISLDARAGIYAYFFTHSAKFLRNKGRMGYITSNTWLDVGFGEGLKQFFLDHFKILAVLEHDAGVFEKAVVDTCVVILEKAEGEKFRKEREENIIRFVRIKKSMDIEGLAKSTERAMKDFEDQNVRVFLWKQSELETKEKWGKYLRAPIIFFRLVKNPKVTTLGHVAKVKFGIKTGANSFFIIDRGTSRQWAIEDEYLKPAVVSPRTIKYTALERNDVDDYLLMVHNSKPELEGKNVLDYIEHGETVTIEIRLGGKKGEVTKGYQNISSVKSRKTWYDLGEREPAPILFPYIIRRRSFFIWNKPKVLNLDVFHSIYPASTKDTLVLLGILNSVVSKFLLESQGRLYGKGLLKIQAYEVADLPVIDPGKLSREERKTIETAFFQFCEAQRKGYKSIEEEASRKLDDAVFDVLNLKERERKQIYEGLELLRRMRLQRKEVEVLVDTAEKWKPHKKPKKERLKPIEPSKRLDKWIER